MSFHIFVVIWAVCIVSPSVTSLNKWKWVGHLICVSFFLVVICSLDSCESATGFDGNSNWLTSKRHAVSPYQTSKTVSIVTTSEMIYRNELAWIHFAIEYSVEYLENANQVEYSQKNVNFIPSRMLAQRTCSAYACRQPTKAMCYDTHHSCSHFYCLKLYNKFDGHSLHILNCVDSPLKCFVCTAINHMSPTTIFVPVDK